MRTRRRPAAISPSRLGRTRVFIYLVEEDAYAETCIGSSRVTLEELTAGNTPWETLPN